ncbi:MAG: 50S ribosomal protein L29 [Thermoplasmata archaeon]
MSILRTSQIRAMPREEKIKTLRELKNELMYERGVAAMGGAPRSPGSIRTLRRQIARILTILREDRK